MTPAPVKSSLSPRARGTLILLLAAILWGSGFVFAQSALKAWSPPVLMILRFGLAGICLLPFVLIRRKKTALQAHASKSSPAIHPWRDALILGLVLWLGYILQTVGLQYTTIGRSAFITAMNVVFTPIFAHLLGRRVRWIIWPCAALALAGTGYLTHDRGTPNAGDYWTLSCAAAWGSYIALLEIIAPRHEPMPMACRQLIVVTLLSIAYWGLTLLLPTTALNHATTTLPAIAPHTQLRPWLELIYLAGIVTALTTWLQTLGQQSVPGPDSSVIYTLEPVFGAGFAWLLIDQTLGPKGLLGSGLILIAALVITRFPPPEPSPGK